MICRRHNEQDKEPQRRGFLCSTHATDEEGP